LPKSLTGIDGFDEITEGGLPTGRPTLVCGPAGSGKSLFALQFLVNGATRYGEPGVFLTFEETRDDLVVNTSSLGLDLVGLERDGKLLIDVVTPQPEIILETGEFNLEALMVRAAWAVEKIGAKRIAIDSAESLFATFATRPAMIRSELQRLFRWFKAQGLTAVITGERGETTLTRHGMEEYLADCVVLLDQRVVQEVTTRRLRVLKYRGSIHGTNEYPFLIGMDGVEVLPITSLTMDQQVSDERFSTGIPGLDEMLGGLGVFRASSVLISGTSGTGKTTLAANFADAACERGETVLFFSFEESPAEILRNMASVGLDLARWVAAGLLHFHCERPTTLGVEARLVAMQRLIHQIAPKLVIIEPVSGLSSDTHGPDTPAMVVRQIHYLKSAGITTVLTSLTGSDSSVSTQHISSLVDTWVLVRTLEGSGERNRGLYVLKSRGMAHSNQIREFILSDNGVRLVPVYIGPAGVLTGSARAAEETIERDIIAGLDEKTAQLAAALEGRREAVEAHVAAIRTDFETEESLTKRLVETTEERRVALQSERTAEGHKRTAASTVDSLFPPPRPERQGDPRERASR
jgi:circadian clock protein KaiC